MISVIIPMYNAEKTIASALQSIKNQQTNELFEILVINDGSVDCSVQKVEDFKNKNPQMNIQIINQKNKGVSAARNAGLRIANGEFIALLDADDEWLPEKTDKQMKFLKNENFGIDFIGSLRNNIKLTFPYRINHQQLAKITLKKLLLKIEAQTSTVIFKKKILQNTGFFDEQQRYSEDANYWMRISQNNNMMILNENLVISGGGKKSFGVSGLSANLTEMEKGIQKNLSEMYKTRRINFLEYLLYFVFSKFKFIIRNFRK